MPLPSSTFLALGVDLLEMQQREAARVLLNKGDGIHAGEGRPVHIQLDSQMRGVLHHIFQQEFSLHGEEFMGVVVIGEGNACLLKLQGAFVQEDAGLGGVFRRLDIHAGAGGGA